MKIVNVLAAALLVASGATQAQVSRDAMSMSMKEAKPGQDAAGALTDAVVQRIDAARGEVILQHGDILNLGMPAMTMAFEVDRKMLDRIRPGDKVRFHAEIMTGKLTVTQIERAR